MFKHLYVYKREALSKSFNQSEIPTTRILTRAELKTENEACISRVVLPTGHPNLEWTKEVVHCSPKNKLDKIWIIGNRYIIRQGPKKDIILIRSFDSTK